MIEPNNSCRYFILALLTALGGCSARQDEQKSEATAVSTATTPIDQSQIMLTPNFEFRLSMGTDDWTGKLYRAMAVTNKESKTFHIRYMVVNNRPDCTLYPIGKDGRISHFGALQNEDPDDVYDGVVNFRTGDETRIGSAITDINMDFLPYEACGRPSNIKIYMDEGVADLEIYIFGK